MTVRARILVLLCSVSLHAHAQFAVSFSKPDNSVPSNSREPFACATLMRLPASARGFEVDSVPMRKSPLLAGALSLAVPGAGQYYNGSLWHAVGFAAAEAVLWIGFAIKTRQADDKTAEFEQFADTHYSVVTYAQWMEQYGPQIYSGVNTSGMYSADASLPPWERIHWTRMNEVEEQLGLAVGSGFTHRLPPRPEQQYFELIGKYPQYGGGWDDAQYFAPGDIISENVSQRFLQYRDMRTQANTLYNFATGTSLVLVANHVISALHAAWSTAHANRAIDANVHLQGYWRGENEPEFVPTLLVRLSL